MVAGLAQWHEQNTTMTGARLHHEYEPDTMRVVAGAVWRSSDALEMTWQYVESAFCDFVLCRFDGDRVAMERHVVTKFLCCRQLVPYGLGKDCPI
jgi:hypothetical protein